MTDCTKGCARCCDPVVLSDENKVALDIALLYPHLVDDLDSKLNANFAARNWKFLYTIDRDGQRYHAFACKWLDKQTNLCTAHNKRPPICRSYPDRQLIENGKLHSTCSYWGEVEWYNGPVPPELPPSAISLNIVEVK